MIYTRLKWSCFLRQAIKKERSGGKYYILASRIRAYVISDGECAQMHIFRYTNERAFNEFFATLHGVTLILSSPHNMCVYVPALLNIILTPHLFGRLWRWWKQLLLLLLCVIFHINLCIVNFGAKLIFFSLRLHNFIPIHEHNFFSWQQFKWFFRFFAVELHQSISLSLTVNVAFHEIYYRNFSKLKSFQLISRAVGKFIAMWIMMFDLIHYVY